MHEGVIVENEDVQMHDEIPIFTQPPTYEDDEHANEVHTQPSNYAHKLNVVQFTSSRVKISFGPPKVKKTLGLKASQVNKSLGLKPIKQLLIEDKVPWKQ